MSRFAIEMAMIGARTAELGLVLTPPLASVAIVALSESAISVRSFAPARSPCPRIPALRVVVGDVQRDRGAGVGVAGPRPVPARTV